MVVGGVCGGTGISSALGATVPAESGGGTLGSDGSGAVD